jgi:hypothetical protein
MKKIILTSLVMILFCKILFGQDEKPITKGNFIIGGSFSFNTEKDKIYHAIQPGTTRQIEITDSKTVETDFYFSYLIIDHLAIGLKTNIRFLNTNQYTNLDPTGYKTRYDNLSVGPLIRYYTKQGIFFEASAEFGFVKDVYSNLSEKWKNNSFSGGVGYSLFLTKSVAIEPEIKYTHTNWPQYLGIEDKETIDGLNFSIGCQIYLSFKKQDHID